MTTYSQDLYRAYASRHALPLYLQPAWLDVVCGDQAWHAAVALDASGEVTGLLPWQKSRRFGLPIIQPPRLTQYSGLHLHYPEQEHFKLQSRYAFTKKVIGQLTAQLPRVAMTKWALHPSHRENLYWHWQGYRESVLYTYRLAPQAMQLTRQNYKNTVRTNLLKAAQQVDIRECHDPQVLHHLVSLVFKRKGMLNPYPLDLVTRVYERLRQMHASTILVAYDLATNAPHSALLLATDATEMHCILTGQDEQYKSSCSLFLLYDHMIELATLSGKTLDLNGSMQPGIEHFFRSFGAVSTPYSLLRKWF